MKIFEAELLEPPVEITTSTREAPSELRPRLISKSGESYDARLIQLAVCEGRLSVPAVINQGDVLELRVDDNRDRLVFATRVLVHWSQPRRAGSEVGVYLHHEVPDELLMWPDWDRRVTLRFPLNIDGRLWLANSPSSTPIQIINYSSGGIAILADESVELGERMQVTTCEAADEMVMVTGTACWQVNGERGHIIGCELPDEQGRRFAGKYRPHPVDDDNRLTRRPHRFSPEE